MSAHGPTALWYATRGAGTTTMLLLTASVVLGIGEERGWRPAKTPRYAVAALHRTISMLALAMLVVHIVTTIADPFPKIGIGAAFIPFATNYRPLWMGLGTVASDLLIALVITSLLRRRLGYRTWRAVHWAAYACWPVAILHGIGTGSDTKATWMLALTVASIAAVLLALLARVARSGTKANARVGATAAATLSAVGLAVWLPSGPLASGWAKRAGTPASVLEAFRPQPAKAAATTTASAPADPFAHAFSVSFSGPIHEGASAGGLEVVDLKLRLDGSPDGVLRIRLGGPALSGGGLRMDRSAVTLGPPGSPAEYQGRVDFLQNTVLRAKVGSAAGRALRLDVNLSIEGDTVEGNVKGSPLA